MITITPETTVVEMKEYIASTVAKALNNFVGQRITLETLKTIEGAVNGTLRRIYESHNAFHIHTIAFKLEVDGDVVNVVGTDKYSAIVLFYVVNEWAADAPSSPAVVEGVEPWPVEFHGDVLGHLHWNEDATTLQYIPTEEKHECSNTNGTT